MMHTLKNARQITFSCMPHLQSFEAMVALYRRVQYCRACGILGNPYWKWGLPCNIYTPDCWVLPVYSESMFLYLSIYIPPTYVMSDSINPSEESSHEGRRILMI